VNVTKFTTNDLRSVISSSEENEGIHNSKSERGYVFRCCSRKLDLGDGK